MFMDSGKRRSGLTLAATSGSRTLLAVTDTNSKHNFLVDTGAEVSIIPATETDRAIWTSTAQRTLRAANGSSIRTYGATEMVICIQGEEFAHKFIKADVQRALLGADFLLKHKLLVDLPDRRILKADTLTAIEGRVKHAEITTRALLLKIKMLIGNCYAISL